jgi:Mg-chelatase subunit ChlI
MRRLLLLAAVLMLTSVSAGCILNMYPADPNDRMQYMLNQSEDLRQIKKEVARFWMVDQPSHLTPDRVHGGIGP